MKKPYTTGKVKLHEAVQVRRKGLNGAEIRYADELSPNGYTRWEDIRDLIKRGETFSVDITLRLQ